MNPKVLYFTALTLPLVVFLNIIQAYDYEKKSRELKAMEISQDQWIEKNKRVITGISVLASPDRISTLAEEDLGLELVPTSDVLKVDVITPGAKK